MNSDFFKEFYPDYLNHTNPEINADKAVFYFESLRTECECPECGNILSYNVPINIKGSVK